jgi:hypothetical protein
MNTPDTTTEAHPNTRLSSAEDLPDYASIPRPALGLALNEQGYYVGRVEQNPYWVTDGTYQSAFLTTKNGVVLLDAPPTIGHNIQRAVGEIASANAPRDSREQAEEARRGELDAGGVWRMPATRQALASSSRAAGRLRGQQSAVCRDQEDARPGNRARRSQPATHKSGVRSRE